jgi:hypothetical protein
MSDPKREDENQVEWPGTQQWEWTPPLDPPEPAPDPLLHEGHGALPALSLQEEVAQREALAQLPPHLSSAELERLAKLARSRRERQEAHAGARDYPGIFGGGELSDFEQRQRAIEGLRTALPEISASESKLPWVDDPDVVEAYETLKKAQQRNRGVKAKDAPDLRSRVDPHGSMTFGIMPRRRAPREGGYRAFGASPPVDMLQEAVRRRQEGEEVTIADIPSAEGETPRQRLLGETITEFVPTGALGVMRYDDVVSKNPTIPGMMMYISAMKSRPEYTRGRSARIKDDIRRAEEFVKRLATTAADVGITRADIVSATKAYRERRDVALEQPPQATEPVTVEEAPTEKLPAEKAVTEQPRSVKPAPAPALTPTPKPAPTVEPEPAAVAPEETAPLTDPAWFDTSQW